MIIIPTDFKDLYVMTREPRSDDLGTFMRTFCKNELMQAGIDFDIIQVNQVLTKHKGTLRGMHHQIAPKEMAKIFQCLKGKIFDVTIDMRGGFPTFHKWFGIELSEDNNKLLYIPKGFSHGYQTLTDDCLVQYFVSQYYSPDLEGGVRWDDPKLAISWPIANPILSSKDKSWSLLT